MLNINLTKQSDLTIEITVEASWEEMASTYNHVVDELVAQVELSGFRKGKAPKEQAIAHIGQTKITEEFLKHIVPLLWNEVIKKYDLKPIIYPKVEVLEFELNKKLKLKIITAEKPEIKLKNYQEVLAQKRKSKQTQIWTPKDQKTLPKEDKLTIDDVVEAILESSEITIPKIVLEQETNRMLADLLDQTQKLGITVEQYLQAKNKTSESIRLEYEQEAKKTLTLELALEQIADTEKIEVSEEEISNFIKQAKTDDEKKVLEKQRYYIGSLLRKQKTLNKLLEPQIISV